MQIAFSSEPEPAVSLPVRAGHGGEANRSNIERKPYRPLFITGTTIMRFGRQESIDEAAILKAIRCRDGGVL